MAVTSAAILLTAALFAAPLLVLGVRLRVDHAFELVAGYNRASEEERAKYDIEGLANHLGNGLLTLGCLLLGGAGSYVLGQEGLAWIALGLFVACAFLIVVGGQKFLPAARHPAPGRPVGSLQRGLRRILPARAFDAIEAGTRQWWIECSCGSRRDLWEAGGIRYKAVGEPRMWGRCPNCEKATWQRVHRKAADPTDAVA